MIFRVSLFLTISLTALSHVFGYDFGLNDCSANKRQQSPINIVTADTKYYDEKYFRFLSNNYYPLTSDEKWSYFEEERAVGFKPAGNQTSLGSFIFVKDWAMYSFNLQKILFRVNSEHQLDGQKFDAEMQLIHTIDPNYYAPGRRVNLGLNYLVISVFFKRTEDANPGRTKLFDFMNLGGFANGTSSNVTRDIKLHYIIQHQPSFLYEGTLTFPECQPALWMLFSQYHWISDSDLAKLTKVIQQKSSIIDANTSFNTRNVFPASPSTEIYRNWNDVDKLTPRPTLLAYNSGSHLNINFVTVLGFLFMACLIIF